MTIDFELGKDVPQTMRREIRRQGWRIADENAYSILRWTTRDRSFLPLSERDVAVATACLVGLTGFFARYGNAVDDGEFHKGSSSAALAEPANAEVTITVRYPGTTWDDDLGNRDEEDLSFFDEDLLEEFDFVADQATASAAAASTAAFIRAQREAGRDSDWIDAAEIVVPSLYRFRARQGYLARAWTADDVEEYMLDYFPARMTADENGIPLVPEVLTAFFTWSLDAGSVDTQSRSAIIKRIKAKRKDFLSEAQSEDNFDAAKVALIAMERAGIDLSNPEAVRRTLQSFERELSNFATPSRPVLVTPAPKPTPSLPRSPRRPAVSGLAKARRPMRKQNAPVTAAARTKKCCTPR